MVQKYTPAIVLLAIQIRFERALQSDGVHILRALAVQNIMVKMSPGSMLRGCKMTDNQSISSHVAVEFDILRDRLGSTDS